MKFRISCTFSILGALFMPRVSWPQSLPPGLPLVNEAKANTTVTFDSNTGLFEYSYSVFNSSVNIGSLESFTVEITTTAGGTTVGSDGLVNTASGFLKIISERNLKVLGASIIPVGLESQPTGWKVAINANGQVSWFAGLQPVPKIDPGHSLTGFTFASRGLPGIRKFRVAAFFEPTKFFPVGIDDIDSDTGTVAIINQVHAAAAATKFSGMTVGPISPPSLTDPGILITLLISEKHQASDLGWISGPGSDGIVNSLDVKLSAAKDSISGGDNKTAANQLNAFINELDAQHGKSINDNAYFLLKANAQFIISKLGGP